MGHATVPKCGATNRQGKPCGNPAGKDTDHFGSGNCKHHGGRTPSGRVSALTERADRLLHQFDAPAVADPLGALQKLAGRALALEETIGRLVNDLTVIRYESEGGGEQLRAEVAVLERAMDRCGRLLVDIAKLNIEERLAKVTEIQVGIIQEAMFTVLGEMGMPPDKQREAQQRIGRRLRVAGTADAA